MAFMEANKINIAVTVAHARALREDDERREAERVAEQQEIERQNRETTGEDPAELPPTDEQPHTTDVVSKGKLNQLVYCHDT